MFSASDTKVDDDLYLIRSAVLNGSQGLVQDGFDATRLIREREQAFPPAAPARPIQIIAMTANAMHGDCDRCLRAGMDDYVAMHTGLEDLQAALDRRPAATPTCA